jgi:hypothetical protein
MVGNATAYLDINCSRREAGRKKITGKSYAKMKG